MTGGEAATPLMRLLQRADIPAAQQQYFARGTIEKVEVYPEQRAWRIFIRLPEPPPADVFVQVTEQVARHLHPLVRVFFHVSYDRLEIADFLQSYWPVLLQRMDLQDHVRQWLQSTSWTLTENTLCLHVKQPLLAEWLEKKHLLNDLKELIASLSGQSLRIRCEYVDDAERRQQWERAKSAKKKPPSCGRPRKPGKKANSRPPRLRRRSKRCLWAKPIDVDPVPLERVVEEERQRDDSRRSVCPGVG